MKRVLQKQRSALKFLASAIPSRPSAEKTSSQVLLTSHESDNIFVTLEEDFHDVLKTATSQDPSHLEKRMRKMWSLILIIRRNEMLLRNWYEKKDTKAGKSKTGPGMKIQDSERKFGDPRKDSIEASKQDQTPRKMSYNISEAEMAASREMFETEKQNLLREIVSMKEKLMKTKESNQDLKKKIAEYEDQILSLKNNVETRSSEATKEMKLRQSLENRVKDFQKQLELRESDHETLTIQLNNAREQLKVFESTVNEQKLTNELLSQNNSHLSQKILRLQSDYNHQTGALEELTQKYTSLFNQAKIYEENTAKMLNDITKNSKMKEVFQKKIMLLETQKKDLQAEKEKLLLSINFLEKKVETTRKMFETEKRGIDDVKREKELLLKNLMRISAASDEQNRIFKIEVRLKDQLESEVNRLNEKVEKQTTEILFLEKEKERLNSKNIDSVMKIQELEEIISDQKACISGLKKQLLDMEANYKHQSCLLESIRNEKNAYFHDLKQAKEAIVDLKQNIKLYTHRVEEEKENLRTKENELLKEKSVLQKLEKDKDKLYSEIAVLKDIIKNTKEQLNESLEMEKKLKNVIERMESEIQKKDKTILQKICEQELLSTQILQKSEEVVHLQTQLKSYEITIEKQESECKQLEDEIINMKLEVKRLTADKAILNRNLSMAAHLRSQIFALERGLTEQKIKCRALEEELQNPVNIHRWRKLEGTDPKTYELITKIQFLQKRVLTKSEIAAEKEQQFKELEKVYDNLRSTVAKLSSYGGSNALFFLRKESEKKNKKIKTLMVEISMYEAHATEYKLELERKNKELEETRKEYLLQKHLFFKLRNKRKGISWKRNNHLKMISDLSNEVLVKPMLPAI